MGIAAAILVDDTSDALGATMPSGSYGSPVLLSGRFSSLIEYPKASENRAVTDT